MNDYEIPEAIHYWLRNVRDGFDKTGGEKHQYYGFGIVSRDMIEEFENITNNPELYGDQAKLWDEIIDVIRRHEDYYREKSSIASQDRCAVYQAIDGIKRMNKDKGQR